MKPQLEKRYDKMSEATTAVLIGLATELDAVATTTLVVASRVDENTLSPTKLIDHTILIGYHRVGLLVGQSLRDE